MRANPRIAVTVPSIPSYPKRALPA